MMKRKTATIERYHLFGTRRHMIRVTYRGFTLSWSEDNGVTAMAQCEHFGTNEENAMRQRAKRMGFTHCRFVGDWTWAKKPQGGKL